MVSRSDSSRIEIVTVRPRRRWTAEDKLRMIQESMAPGNTVSQVARENGVNPNQLFAWRKLMTDAGKIAVSANDEVVSLVEVKALKKRIRELERALGKATLQNQILNDAIEIAREKKLISDLHLPSNMNILQN